MEHLKERIKELRQLMGWTQEDLAREIGISLSTIQRWEKQGSKINRLTRRELERLFRKAGVIDKQNART